MKLFASKTDTKFTQMTRARARVCVLGGGGGRERESGRLPLRI